MLVQEVSYERPNVDSKSGSSNIPSNRALPINFERGEGFEHAEANPLEVEQDEEQKNQDGIDGENQR